MLRPRLRCRSSGILSPPLCPSHHHGCMKAAAGAEGISGDEALENIHSVEIMMFSHSEDTRANIQNRLDSLVLDWLNREDS